MRKFARGCSDVTFSKTAVQVSAGEAIIYKEFHLSSADRKIVGVDKAVRTGSANALVAEVGNEAIHPKAAKPLELAGVKRRIKNTFQPEHPGTLISREYVLPKVEIVLEADRGIPWPVILGRAKEALSKKHIDIKYVGQSQNQMSMQFVVLRDRCADTVRLLNDALCLRRCN